jgi:CelD/BcsL family acetyltransferase involved in cellulose biosynthesis
MEITKTANEDEWNELLARSDNATIYHTPEWKQFLEKTFNYKPRYLFAKDDVGDLVGMLPLFEVRSKLTGNRLSSVPFSHSCGIIGQDDVLKSLVDEAMLDFESIDAKYFEIREGNISDKFDVQNSYSTYILDVSKPIDELWTNLSSNARRATRKSDKIGLASHKTNSHDDLKTFYNLNSMTKKELGVPCHPWKFFKNLFDILDDKVSLYVVKYNGDVIAGGIREYYKDTIVAGYAASDPKYKNLNPYNSLNWQSIQDASNSGYKYYDLGRVSYQNEGLLFFKSRWGTVEKKLYYSYYPKNPKSVTDKRSGSLYKVATTGIKNMSMSAYKQFSKYAFSHFG